jgi:hypothetical protein
MQKPILTLLLATLGFSASISAQITVTNATFPAAGDTLRLAIDHSPAGIEPLTPPGGPQSWDFTSLQADVAQSIIYKPSSQGSQGANVPGAELFAALSPNTETYYNVTPTKFELQAYWGILPYDLVANNLFEYNPPLPERRAPLNFFDISASSSGFLEVFPPTAFPALLMINLAAVTSNAPIDSMRYRVAISSIDVVDAYGTVSIPGGTFDVLREKRTRYTETRIDAKIPPLGWLDLTDLCIQAGFNGLGVDTLVSFYFHNDLAKEHIAIVTLNNQQNAVEMVQFKQLDAVACELVIADISTSPAGCPNGNDGSIMITAAMSLGALTYSISGPVNQSNNTGMFVGLPVGNYTVTVTDSGAANCLATANASVGGGMDAIPPMAVCRNAVVLLDTSGQYILQATDVLDFDASADNCGSFEVVSISPASVDCSSFGTTVPIVVTISDPSGNTDDCIAGVYVDNSAALPAPWGSQDIGSSGSGNSYDYASCTLQPAYTINTGAANNSLPVDNLATIAQTLCGDFSIEVKIESVTPNGWAGLSARQSSAPGSKMIAMYSNLGSIVRWESRLISGAPKSINLLSRPFPYWLRLVRQGNLFIGYYSVNGSSYSIVNLQSNPMGSCLEVGVAAFTSLPGQAATAVFSNLAASGGVLPISTAPGNAAEAAQAERTASPRLWPNPARDIATLEIPAAPTETRLRLLNQLGQPLEERLLPAGERSQLEWPIGHLPAGLYFVEVFSGTDQNKTVLRLVKTD